METLPAVIEVSKQIAKSRFFEDAKEEAQAVVKVLAGQEIGIGPIAAMTGIHVIKNKVAIGANLMASQVKASGKYDFEVKEFTDKLCRLRFYKGDKFIGESKFDMEDAAQAELLGNAMWKKYPRNMLFARAISNGVRWYCADVLTGITAYTPEELGDSTVAADDPTIIEGEFVPTPAADEQPTQQPDTADDRAKRTRTINAIMADWEARAALDPNFGTANRRKSSIMGCVKARWPAGDVSGMLPADALAYWFENAPMDDLKAYFEHNRARRLETAKAAKEQEAANETA